MALRLLMIVLVGFKSAGGVDESMRRNGKQCFSGDGDDLRLAISIYLFGGAEEIQGLQDQYGATLNEWCVDFVHDFSYVFCDQTEFNEDISAWNTSSAITMEGMFWNARAFDSDLLWNVAKVKEMKNLFREAVSFRGRGLENWDVRNVRSMESAFQDALSFDSNLCGWGSQLNSIEHDVVAVDNMFHGSGCLVTNSPWLDANNNLVGSFCTTCDSESTVPPKRTAFQEPIPLFKDAEMLTEEAVERSSIADDEDDKDEPITKLSVHTHEATAKGAQFILFAIFVMYGLILVRVGRQHQYEQGKHTDRPQTGNYHPVALSNPAKEAESEL